jgi:hypothetical protein
MLASCAFGQPVVPYGIDDPALDPDMAETLHVPNPLRAQTPTTSSLTITLNAQAPLLEELSLALVELQAAQRGIEAQMVELGPVLRVMSLQAVAPPSATVLPKQWKEAVDLLPKVKPVLARASEAIRRVETAVGKLARQYPAIRRAEDLAAEEQRTIWERR